MSEFYNNKAVIFIFKNTQIVNTIIHLQEKGEVLLQQLSLN